MAGAAGGPGGGAAAGVAGTAALPVDAEGPNTVAERRTVSVALDPERTAELLREVPGVFRTQVNDVLLAVLGRVLGEWCGAERVLVDLEGHGREELPGGAAGVDVSRTVGWFTSVFPVALRTGTGWDWGELLKAVKEDLRSVPNRGIGFGALRHLGTPEQRAALEDVPAPRVSFNYLGRFDAGTAAPAVRFLTDPGDPRHPRAHLLEVVGRVAGGRLVFDWAYARTVHEEGTVRALAERFTAGLADLVRFCLAEGVGGATPSDFPLVALDQAAVDRLVGDGRDVADVYPLTPMQQGMLFHSVLEPESSSYFEQLVLLLDGVADTAALAAAWRRCAWC
ncbi:hypothetical protein DEF28_22170 [Marinitenerispora sediminis]|nr:hypothetical protein DEF28_22170 [Marinitenerispora sediminis]